MKTSSFTERLPWLGGDLQTLRNSLTGAGADLSAWPEERIAIRFPNADGTSCAVHGEMTSGDAPAVVLIHGLTGCEDSAYIRQAARFFLDNGYLAVRVNLRGAGPSRGRCKEHYNAGRSSDLQVLLDGLAEAIPEYARRPLYLVGFSLGGNMLLKFLGERRETLWKVCAGVSVSAPIDLKRTQLRMMAPRNAVYHRYILDRMKAETPGVSAVQRRSIKSVWQFDEEIVGPSAGFEGAEDYYEKCSAKGYLGSIEVPTLLLHADNDPWIPSTMYEHGAWRENAALRIEITRGGGHVGFHGTAGRTPWYALAAHAFFAERKGKAD